MTNVEQLERETEQARTQLSSTLDELRACMTPGHLVDQLADRVSDGAAAAFARNLKDQAIKNPLPVAMMGASLAWMMLGSSRTGSATGLMHRAADRVRDVADDVGSTARQARRAASEKGAEWNETLSSAQRDATDSVGASAERAKESAASTERRMREGAASAAESARQTASGAVDDIRETAGSMANSAQRAASDSYDAAADTARGAAASISDTTKAAGRRTVEASNSLLEFCREQPLLLTGIGIAVGAFLGALLPSTEAEDRIMGGTSDRLKESAENLASERYENVKQAGERALDTTQAEASEHGPGKMQGSPGDEPTLVPDEPHLSEGERRGEPVNADRTPT